MRKTDNHSEPPSLVELIDKEFNEQLNISKNTSEKLDDDDIKS